MALTAAMIAAPLISAAMGGVKNLTTQAIAPTSPMGSSAAGGIGNLMSGLGGGLLMKAFNKFGPAPHASPLDNAPEPSMTEMLFNAFRGGGQ